MYGFFERAPQHDLKPGSHHWRAFRYVDGGIWYARDDEDFTLARKDRCEVCSGYGRFLSCEGLGREACGFPELCGSAQWCGFRPVNCAVCDGRGYVFVASRINQG